jgi:hypothetical protein
MAEILLHKQTLTPEQLAKLEAQGVIAIQTERPEDFHFLDLQVPQIEMNDMVWALLDAADTKDQSAGDVRRKLVANLAKLANEKRAGTLATQLPGAGS